MSLFYRGQCGSDFLVQQNPAEGFYLIEPCFANHPTNTPLNVLRTHCDTCPSKRGGTMPLPKVSLPPPKPISPPTIPIVASPVVIIEEPAIPVEIPIQPTIPIPPVIQPTLEPMIAKTKNVGLPMVQPPISNTPKPAPITASTTPEALPATNVDMSLSGLEDELSVDINSVLDSVSGMVGGPSRGGFSWSTMKYPMECWRKAWYALVMGLGKPGGSKAMHVGSIVHACFEMHYRTGGIQTFAPCDAVAQAGAPGIAGEARRLVYGSLSKYGHEEAANWDVRAIENQGTWFMPPEKVGNKRVYIPLTCRHDLIVAMRETPGGPCVDPGKPVPHGSYILDWKSASALTYDLTKGYSMDPQFLMNALIYLNAEVDQFGPLAGVIISILVKHKNLDPEKSFFRIYANADVSLVKEFYLGEIRPYALELYSRLVDGNKRTDRTCWPKNHSSCVGRYGVCPYFDICDTPSIGEDAVMSDMYIVNESRILDVNTFLEPPKEVKYTRGRTIDQVEEEEGSRLQRKAERDLAKSEAVGALLNNMDKQDAFQPNHWIGGEDKKKQQVIGELSDFLSKSLPLGTDFELETEAEKTCSYLVTAKGISWIYESCKGSLSWKTIARNISDKWWDPGASDPGSGE